MFTLKKHIGSFLLQVWFSDSPPVYRRQPLSVSDTNLRASDSSLKKQRRENSLRNAVWRI